jgi:soluble lytic murein transglycosylase
MARLTLVWAGLISGLVAAGLVGPDESRNASADNVSSTAPITFTGRPFGLSNTLSVEDTARLNQGIAAIERNDFVSAQRLASGNGNVLVQRYLEWRRLTDEDAMLSFGEIDSGLNRFAGWPRMDNLRRRGEQAILSAPMTPADRITWLRRNGGPLEGSGRAALAIALSQTGQAVEATTLARKTWREDPIAASVRDSFRAQFSNALSAEDYAARADMLWWLGQRTDAANMAALATPAQRSIIQARLAARSSGRMDQANQNDPGVLYELARSASRRRDNYTAIAFAKRIDATRVHPAGREVIWDLRRVLIREALRDRDYNSAYQMSRASGLTGGEKFADAEWMAGWLALRYLNRPADAKAHFTTLETGVRSPVSKARAHYWLGLAMAAAGDAAASSAELTKAAAYPTAFYGQLAIQKLTPGAPLVLPAETEPTPEQRTAFEERELIKVLKMLGGVGNDDAYEGIAFFIDDQLQTAVEHRMLSDLSRQAGEPRAALRSAKAGLQRNIISTEATYPLLRLPTALAQTGRTPEPALVLAITRQESEFNPKAVSRANARGLMQLLPATAAMQARREGIPYSTAALTDDPDFNVTLGAAHLKDLVDEWNGSYILAIASYNAGASRPREWIGIWGDPRQPGVDPVDWIELIPFSETRNYVQRVMENMIVYRARLSAQPSTVRLQEDLKRGGR